VCRAQVNRQVVGEERHRSEQHRGSSFSRMVAVLAGWICHKAEPRSESRRQRAQLFVATMTKARSVPELLAGGACWNCQQFRKDAARHLKWRVEPLTALAKCVIAHTVRDIHPA